MPESPESLQQGLAFIDIVIVGLYMFGVFALGTFFGKYVKNAGDFFVAGRALPFWAIGMSVVVSDIGATDFIATAGAGYTYGVSAANFDWIGSMPAMVFAAFIFIPYYWRSGVYTIPEFLGRRYNQMVQVIHAAIWGIFLLVMLSVMLWLTAQMLYTVVGLPPVYSVILIVLITGVYTFSGGLSAVVLTDVVQLIVMFVGGAALVVLSLIAAGGWAAIRDNTENRAPDVIIRYEFASAEEREGFEGKSVIETVLDEAGIAYQQVGDAIADVPEKAAYFVTLPGEVRSESDVKTVVAMRDEIKAALDDVPVEGAAVEAELRDYPKYFKLLLPHDSPTPYPWTGIVFGLGIVMATAYMSGNQAVVQRTLGARSEWDAKGGMLFAGFLKAFIPVLIIFPGLAAVAVLPPMSNGDMAVPTMIREFMPPGLRGLMFAALFAALMSSVDSYLNSATTIWTTDLLGRAYENSTGKPLTSRQGLVIGRVFTVAFIVAAGAMSPLLAGQETMYNFIQTSLSMFQGPVFAILLLGILWRRANQWGALTALITGVALTTVLNNTPGLFPSDDPFLFVSWWSFVYCVVCHVMVSLLTPADPDDKVRGLIFGQVMRDGEIQRVLAKRSAE